MITTENSMSSGNTRKDDSCGSVLARIDQYELVRELGGGGFGTVYLAKDIVSGVEYAVKGLPPLVKNNREEMENIRANFALVSRLSHTNIARAHVLHPAREVYYASEDVRQKLRVLSGDFLMVMEYAPGVTLSQWRRQFTDRKVPLAQALEIARQVASALDYAHEQKILHRDVKPANVMIETKPGGRLVARVLDFGLAAEIRSSLGRVSREIHNTSGTRPYMAPEQWLGDRQGPTTDQYAFAALFHELVTGYVPFASVFDTGDTIVMMNVVAHRSVSPPTSLPKHVRLALAVALAKKPEERFASCGEFVAALEDSGRIRLRRGFDGREERKERKGFGKAVAVLAILAAIGGGAWWWQANEKWTESTTETTRTMDAPCAPQVPVVPQVPAAPAPSVPPAPPVVKEPVRQVDDGSRAAAEKIRAEAVVHKSKVERIPDGDGFRERKDVLAGAFKRADAFLDDKVRRWSDAAQQFTNFVNRSRMLVALDDERRIAVAKRTEAESARLSAADVAAESLAPSRWQEAVGLFELATNEFSQMRFHAAGQSFDNCAKKFLKCADAASVSLKGCTNHEMQKLNRIDAAVNLLKVKLQQLQMKCQNAYYTDAKYIMGFADGITDSAVQLQMQCMTLMSGADQATQIKLQACIYQVQTIAKEAQQIKNVASGNLFQYDLEDNLDDDGDDDIDLW